MERKKKNGVGTYALRNLDKKATDMMEDPENE